MSATGMTVSVWGPESARRRRPGVRHILLGLALLVVLSAVPTVVLLLHLAGTMPAEELGAEVTRLLTKTGPGLMTSLAITWLALVIPVAVAGRLVDGGWRSLVRWQVRWREDLAYALAFTVAARGVEACAGRALSWAGVDASSLSNGDMLSAGGAAWLPLLAVGAAVAAPLTEELFFRGLTMRVLLGQAGRLKPHRPLFDSGVIGDPAFILGFLAAGSAALWAAGHEPLAILAAPALLVAPAGVRMLYVRSVARGLSWPVVLVTSLMFGLMHAQATAAASAYTIASTAIVGAGLSALVLRTGRLGTSVLAHSLFNASAVALLLLSR